MFTSIIKDACKNSKNCTNKCTCFLLPFNLHQQTSQSLTTTQSLAKNQSFIKSQQVNKVQSNQHTYNKDLKIRPFYM
jgi:hypothetical protein